MTDVCRNCGGGAGLMIEAASGELICAPCRKKMLDMLDKIKPDKFVLDSSKLREKVLQEARKSWKPSMSEEEGASHLVDVCLRVFEERERLRKDGMNHAVDMYKRILKDELEEKQRLAVEELKKSIQKDICFYKECRKDKRMKNSCDLDIARCYRFLEQIDGVFKFAEKDGK